MGRIQHHELNTSDLDGAKRFYGAVFGWTFDDMPMPTGVYSMVKTAGGDGFGGFQTHPMPGAPSAWLDYVSVGSLADTLAKVTANGGTIAVPAMDIPGMGSFAVCQDPQGAHFAIWQAAAGSPTPPPGSGSPLGLIQHHELNTSDVDGAKRFYAAVFGWTYDEVPMPTGVYSIVKTAEGEGLGGVWANPVPGAPSAWLNYVNVASLAEALAKVTAHGGKILMPATEVPGMGSFAVCEDPQGAAIAMWQAAAAAAAPPPPPPPKPKSAPPPPKPKSAPPAPKAAPAPPKPKAEKPAKPAKPAEPAAKPAKPAKKAAAKPAKKKAAKKAAAKPAKPAKKAAAKPAKKAAAKPAKKAAAKPAKKAAAKPAKKAAAKPAKKKAAKPAKKKAAKKPAKKAAKKAAKKPAKKAAKKPAKKAKKKGKK